MREKNSCYTYFKITGDFDPDEISDILGMSPEKQKRKGELRKNGTAYEFARWEACRCDNYDVFVENQMLITIRPLLSKVKQLKKIKELYEVYFTLEIVPSIYVGETNPCLSPSRQVIQFCYETETDIDIDLYIFDSAI